MFSLGSIAFICEPIGSILSAFLSDSRKSSLAPKNRTADAESSLAWLRGWVQKETVHQELLELQRYSEQSKSCSACIKLDQKCTHHPTFMDKLKELKRKKTLKPFFIVMSLFFIAEFTGITDQAAAMQGFVNNLANIAFLCLIRFTVTAA
ncbi:uncharacterized protein LOC116351119 [Contarinia nasturtii]|uniref:uncharacterized protein LOC116351119 n=1 Tax=Contarinia nasturtii TaxID=265458 RepID=UPI0012D41824|nr:uncharacterized protein LOC116351119 [Contarinia nasturtii]